MTEHVRVEPVNRVRVQLGGELLADSTRGSSCTRPAGPITSRATRIGSSASTSNRGGVA